MAFYLGHRGNVRLRRGSQLELGTVSASVEPDDINTSLNRLGFEDAVENLVTGDRVIISTKDNRRLDFIPDSRFGDLEFLQTQDGNALITQSGDSLYKNGLSSNDFSAYINVNAAGGLRLYPSFADAINNERTTEIALENFVGGPMLVELTVRDVRYNTLGNVTSYEFNTSRESIDITSLTDKYKQQYNAGLLSGAGRLECGFDYRTESVNEPPIVMLQTIQRLDLGCDIDLALYLTDEAIDPDVSSCFYLATAIITSTGITVEAGGLINCTIDFVTTGEIRLVIGKPSDYILKEDDDRIQVEPDLGYLLQEVTD